MLLATPDLNGLTFDSGARSFTTTRGDTMYRNTDGTLASHAWPGGYPIFYIAEDGGILCSRPECANGPEVVAETALIPCDRDPQWHIVGQEVNWEDESLFCDHCGKLVECAYPSD